MPPKKDVLILGCGLGGLVAAKTLSRLAPRHAAVTVIERKTSFQLPALYPRLMMGWREPKQVQRDLKTVSRKNVKVINDNVKSINVQKKRVKTDSSELSYDFLILALGADYAPETIPGFQQYAHHIYDLESTLKFRHAIENFPDSGNLAVGISRVPFKCPAAPYEAALLLEHDLRKRGKNPNIRFFTPEATPIPGAGAVIGKQVERILTARGIQFLPGRKLEKVAEQKTSFDDGTEIPFDLLLAVPPHKCPKVAVDSGLTDSSGWVPVNPQTMMTKFDDVYAIGDVASVETPHGHTGFLPKAGVFARGQAEVVANNIAFEVTGKGERKAWDGTGDCFLEVSKGESAFLKGSFLSRPPRLEFHPPMRKWHLAKVRYAESWFKDWL